MNKADDCYLVKDSHIILETSTVAYTHTLLTLHDVADKNSLL